MNIEDPTFRERGLLPLQTNFALLVQFFPGRRAPYTSAGVQGWLRWKLLSYYSAVSSFWKSQEHSVKSEKQSRLKNVASPMAGILELENTLILVIRRRLQFAWGSGHSRTTRVWVGRSTWSTTAQTQTTCGRKPVMTSLAGTLRLAGRPGWRTTTGRPDKHFSGSPTTIKLPGRWIFKGLR